MKYYITREKNDTDVMDLGAIIMSVNTTMICLHRFLSMIHPSYPSYMKIP
jgi:hypothetical protein